MTRLPNDLGHKSPHAATEAKSSPREDIPPSLAGLAGNRDVRILGEFMVFFDGCTDRNGQSDWFVRIYDAASGEETLLAPPERDRWAEWIMARVTLPETVKLTFSATASDALKADMPPPARRHPANAARRPHIEVLHVHFAETTPDRPPLAEIRFRLSGAKAELLTRQRAPYRIETYAVDLKERKPALLAAKEGRLEPQTFEYTDRQTFTLPDVGRYELHSRVLLLPPGDQVGCHRGPVLNVVP
jgi:hypothetical protein